MTDRDRTCPDCGVTMADVNAAGSGDARQPAPSSERAVTIGERAVALDQKWDNSLGTSGSDETATFTTVMCPECGLLRRYAGVEE